MALRLPHRLRSGSRLGAVVASLALTLPAAAVVATGSAAPVSDLADVRPTAAAAPASTVWRYGRAYPNGLPAARTNSTAYAAPAVLPVGAGAPWVATGTPDGWVRVRGAESGAWVADLYTGPGGVQASPAVVDWDRDGAPDIVAANLNGDLVVWTAGGRQLMRTNLYTENLPTRARGIFGTPAVGDLDGDGWAEIVVSSWDHHLYVVDHAGAVRKKVFLKDTMWASPAIADVDGDGRPEVVAAWDCDANSGNFDCAYGDPGGFVGVFTRDLVLRWKQFMRGQAAWSSPAVGPLQGDGRLAIVLATGQMPCMMHTGAAGPCGTGSAVDTRQTGRRLYAFDAATGAPLPGWPAALPEKTMSSPALADVDGDGRAEVFVGTGGRLYRVDSDGRARWGWDTCIALQKSPCGYSPLPKVDASPVVGDLLGDGRQVVAIGYDFKIQFLDAATGALVAQTEPARAAGEISQALGNGLTATTWGGRTRLYSAIMLCRSDCYGSNPVWDAGTVAVDAGPAGSRLGWPTFRGQLDRTGRAAAPPPVPAGAIGAYWTGQGGARGWLGQPTSYEYAVPGGRAQDFAGGRVYWSSGTGAHGVRGGILGRYLGLGGPAALGLPTTDEVDGGAPGVRMSVFQNGRVYWSSATGAHPVQGAVLLRWLAIGGPSGALGLPVAAEEPGGLPGSRTSVFQRGRIWWSSPTGAVEVYGGILGKYLQLGGPARLGLPTRPEHDRDGGRAVTFTGGRIWWTPSAGARSLEGGILLHFDGTGGAPRYGLPTSDEQRAPGRAWSLFPAAEIHWAPEIGTRSVQGAIRGRWLELGGVAGLGLPLTDEANGSVPGSRWSHFQRGEVHWSATTGAHEVRGGIRDVWRSLGSEGGRLGLPTSGEHDVPGGRRSLFQRGSITWSSATGAMTVTYS